MTVASEFLAKVRGKAKSALAAPAQSADVDNDEGHSQDVAALEAEHEAAQTAIENGDVWNGRDPSVIEAEMHAAQRAAMVSAELNMGANGNITRKEFEEFKIAVAIAFIGIETALRDPSVSPRKVLNLVMQNAAAMGFSRSQVKALSDFEHKAKVVEKHYGDWDRRTKSRREYSAQQAAMQRPR
jgi:hypothetical protein